MDQQPETGADGPNTAAGEREGWRCQGTGARVPVARGPPPAPHPVTRDHASAGTTVAQRWPAPFVLGGKSRFHLKSRGCRPGSRRVWGGRPGGRSPGPCPASRGPGRKDAGKSRTRDGQTRDVRSRGQVLSPAQERRGVPCARRPIAPSACASRPSVREPKMPVDDPCPPRAHCSARSRSPRFSPGRL